MLHPSLIVTHKLLVDWLIWTNKKKKRKYERQVCEHISIDNHVDIPVWSFQNLVAVGFKLVHVLIWTKLPSMHLMWDAFFFHFQNKCQCQDALNSSYALIYQIISKWKIIYPLVWDLWSLGTRWYNCTYLCDGEVEMWFDPPVWNLWLLETRLFNLYMFEEVEF